MIVRTNLSRALVASIVVPGVEPRKKGAEVIPVRTAECDLAGRSHSHPTRLRVVLTGNGRYHGNSGQWGAVARVQPSASYADHGRWMAVLYALDPSAIVGPYRNAEHFYVETGGAFPIPDVRIVEEVGRLASSVNGNPRFSFGFADGSTLPTKPDAGWAYGIVDGASGTYPAGTIVAVTVDGRNRITGAEIVGKAA